MNGLSDEFVGDGLAYVRLDANTPEGAAAQAQFQVRGHPASVILDRSGEPIATFVGARTADEIRPIIEQALASGQ